MNHITKSTLSAFRRSLQDSGKAQATIVKYVFYVERMAGALSGRELTKKFLLEYRDELMGMYKVQTVNGNLSAINACLEFCGLPEMKLKLLRVQRQAFLEERKELSKEEYRRLLGAARSRGGMNGCICFC